MASDVLGSSGFECLGLSRRILVLFTRTGPWRYFRLQLPQPSPGGSCHRAAALVKTLALRWDSSVGSDGDGADFGLSVPAAGW